MNPLKIKINVSYVYSSFCFFVTSQWRHILSNGSSLRRAVDCIIAVSNDCGLKNPANQIHAGSYEEHSKIYEQNNEWV